MVALKYELIADSLRQRIADGEFTPDDLLPSQRDLSMQWNVSRATVIKAYDVLIQDGLVVARQGQGFRVTTTPLARPAAWKEGRDCPDSRRARLPDRRHSRAIRPTGPCRRRSRPP